MINSGCWNVRTLYYTGRLARVLREMHQYKISLVCIMESGWTGAEKRQLATGDTILWLGRNDNQHRQEVALIIQKGKSDTHLEWKLINERLFCARTLSDNLLRNCRGSEKRGKRQLLRQSSVNFGRHSQT